MRRRWLRWLRRVTVSAVLIALALVCGGALLVAAAVFTALEAPL